MEITFCARNYYKEKFNKDEVKGHLALPVKKCLTRATEVKLYSDEYTLTKRSRAVPCFYLYVTSFDAFVMLICSQF